MSDEKPARDQKDDTASILDELVGEASNMKEFQNVNVPNVDWNQLNQRLRGATTDEQVDDILGKPEGALGPGSISSAKPRARKVHNFDEGQMRVNVTRGDRPFYNRGVNQLINTSQDNTNLPPARQKALFRGRYFPSFGLICAPLAGTEIFPMAPRMEKVHFAVAADMPQDHFDGEPQQQYLDDIKAYMKPIFDSYQLSNKARYLHRFRNPDFDEEWRIKFPYSSHRLHEGNAIRGTIGENEIFKTSIEADPDLFQNYQEHLQNQDMGEKHGKGQGSHRFSKIRKPRL